MAPILWADEPSVSATSDLAQLLANNNLQAPGKKPFHLRMTFQVYDPSGAPTETGTAEDWWAGDDGFRLEVSAPSLGTVHDLRTEALPSETAKRTLFLVGQLLDAARAPGGGLAYGSGEIIASEQRNSEVVLHCMRKEMARPGSPPLVFGSICADETGNIRMTRTGDASVLRNKTGIFAGTRVALKEQLSYGDRVAISGVVETLLSFDPAKASVELKKPQAASAVPGGTPKEVRLAGGVLAGQLINRQPPIYPLAARERRISGTVLLQAEVDEAGQIKSLFAISSPSPLLTTAALDAVRKWTYRPYLLNGTPVSVNATVTVNFNITHSVVV